MEAMGIIFSNIYDNNMGELTRERTSASTWQTPRSATSASSQNTTTSH